MNSSRIFKQDPLFTPISLIQGSIMPPDAAATGSFAAKDITKQPDHDIFNTSALDTAPEAAVLAEPPVPADPIAPPDVQALREEAYNQGKTDQAQLSELEFQQSMAAFAMACQKIDGQRKALLHQSRGDIINLIIAMVKKILGQELTTPRNIIAGTLQTALEQAIQSQEFHVTLHPDDLGFAKEKAPEIIGAISGLEHIVFKTDETISRGGCLLESAVCTVDATIETQVESVRDFLSEQPAALPTPDLE